MNRLFHPAFLFLIVVLIVSANRANAQCEGQLGTTRVTNPTQISVQLPHTMQKTDFDEASSPGKWILIDVSKGPAAERIFRVVEIKPDPPNIFPVTHVDLILNRSLEPDREYRLFAPDITYHGCRPNAVPEGTVTFKSPPAAGTRPPSPEKDFFQKSPSKGREDSNVYLSGQLEGANGSSPQVSADIKFEPRIETSTFFQELGLYFNLKASTAKAADANAMNFGLKLRHSFAFPVRLKKGTPEGVIELADEQPFLSGVVWDLTPGFESDRRFDNVNVLLGNRFVFVPRVFGNTNRIYLQPFIGFEVGRNIKSPVKEAEDRAIARGTVGGSLYLNLMPKADKALSFQIDYVRRFLLLREISFTENDDKKLVPLPVGRGPRDYVKVILEYGFTDFLGTALSYEYGRLPPNFQLVDHKYGFGLTYKFKTRFPK